VLDKWETQEGEERSAPHIGVVLQAPKNFWIPLSVKVERKGDLDELVYEVIRVGKKDGTTYQFEDYDAKLRPDLSEFEFPSIVEWIADKGSTEYYDSELSGYKGQDEDDFSNDTADSEKPASVSKGTQPEADERFEALKAQLQEREAQKEPVAAS